MHGLINRAIQCFVRDTYGPQVWADVADGARLGFRDFEAMLVYEAEQTQLVLNEASKRLGKPVDVILEDAGTYLVSNSTQSSVRRLLRYGGDTFSEFLGSVADLPDRAKLAVPDLTVPELELVEHDHQTFSLKCRFPVPGSGHFMMGVLRAMADEYGALVLMEFAGGDGEAEHVNITVHAVDFAEARSFSLAAGAMRP